VPVVGDFAALDKMQRVILAMGGKGPDAEQFRYELLTNCAEAARDALEQSFIAGIDPYGRPWKALTSRTGHPLRDTGILASSWTRAGGGKFPITNEGFIVETNLIYATTHQYGATITAKNSPFLVFFTRGVPTARNKRGDKQWHRLKSVTVPRRQMIPEESTGGMGRWGDAVNEEAKAIYQKWTATIASR